MPNTNLSNIKFPVIHCTQVEYNSVSHLQNTLYIITDATVGSPTVYLNDLPISNITSQSGSVASVNDVIPDSVGNVQLEADDLNTYSKSEVDTTVGSVLNIQYLKAPINAITVDTNREIYTQEMYPIADKNMVTYEDDSIIKFIVVSSAGTNLNKIVIRTMNKSTHAYTDEDTGNTYSTATNGVGYEIMFVDNTYVYLSRTLKVQTAGYSNRTADLYKLNYTSSNSLKESIASFPLTPWTGTKFFRVGSIVYGFGGGQHNWCTANFNSIFKYDITNNVWTTLSSKLPAPWMMHTSVYGDSSFLSGNYIYLTLGYQSNTSTQWSQKYAYRFNISTETGERLPDRSVSTYIGATVMIDIGWICMAFGHRTEQTVTWKDYASQIYIPKLNRWLNFKHNLTIKSGSNTSALYNGTIVKTVDINHNIMHLIVDGVSYNMTLSLSTLGIFSTNEVIFIKGIIQCDKDVETISGALILANTDIPANTEVKIIHDDTKVILLSDITTDGSWIKRPPYTLTGIQQDRVLWDGNVGTNNSTLTSFVINLTDSIHNYDKIGINFNSVDVNGKVYHEYKEFTQYEITEVIDTYHDNPAYNLTLYWGYENNDDRIELLSTSDEDRLDINCSMAHLKRITGINTKAPL